MDIVTLGAALNGSAEYVNSHFKGGSNIQIVDNPDGTQTINASGEVSSEDAVARAEIAAIKDGETLDSFGDVETALDDKQNTISDLATIRSGAALGATAVQPETGKGLSSNDFTTDEKTKLAGIAEGAEVNVQSNWTQTTTTADDYIKNKPTLGTAAALDVATSGNAATSQVVKGDDTRLTDARNAADVSSWAKAANKPSYNGSEIALTGYTEAQSKSSVAATDTANTAIGKLEYRVKTNESNNSLITPELIELVDSGAKNLIPVTRDEIKAANSNLGWNGYTATNGGITFTLNEDMSITLNGTSTSTVELTLMPRSANRSMFKSAGSYELQCIVPSGSSWYVAVNRTVSGSGVTWGNDSGSGLEFTVSVSDVGAPNGIWIAIPRSVQINNVTIYPMICTKAAWDISQKYVPYAPTNAELYKMIKALQS